MGAKEPTPCPRPKDSEEFVRSILHLSPAEQAAAIDRRYPACPTCGYVKWRCRCSEPSVSTVEKERQHRIQDAMVDHGIEVLNEQRRIRRARLIGLIDDLLADPDTLKIVLTENPELAKKLRGHLDRAESLDYARQVAQEMKNNPPQFIPIKFDETVDVLAEQCLLAALTAGDLVIEGIGKRMYRIAEDLLNEKRRRQSLPAPSADPMMMEKFLNPRT